MHMLIYAHVDAPDRDSAFAAGRITFDRLVGAELNAAAVFDYYVTFDEQGTTVAGPARWGGLELTGGFKTLRKEFLHRANHEY